MLKFEIRTKNHMGDKRTWLKYETTNVQDVLKAFGWDSMKKEHLLALLDGKNHGFQMRTGVRLVNAAEVKDIVLNIIGE
jgi:hypothetical protein